MSSYKEDFFVQEHIMVIGMAKTIPIPDAVFMIVHYNAHHRLRVCLENQG